MTRVTSTALPNMHRIPSLDGLRAFAIAIVLIGHASHAKGFPWSNWRLDLLANTGVRLFFVLSGFLITNLLIGEKEQKGSVSLKNFYVRRAFRILPAFYLYLFFISALAALRLIAIPGRDLLYAYAYLSNFRPGQFHLVGHLWSLSVEEQFYLLWPTVIAFGVSRTHRLVLLTAVILAPVLRCVMWSHSSSAHFVEQSFFTICDTLAVGCALALYRRELHASRLYRKLFTKRSLIALLTLSFLILELAKLSPLVFQISQSVLNVALALILDVCIIMQPRVLNTRSVMVVGTWSYSIYLWQQVFCSSVGHWWELFPINIILSVMVAYGSFRFVEQPALRMRRRREQALTPAKQVLQSVG